MKVAKSGSPCVLTINGGSSSIRFAMFGVGETPVQRLDGKIDRIGSSGAHLAVDESAGKPQISKRLPPPTTARQWVSCWTGSTRSRSSPRSRPWGTEWGMA